MDYKYIETLVKQSKEGNEISKENLAKEFTPYIKNLCSKTFIHGYDFYYLQNECFQSLFKCVSSYNLENHRFVAYATNGIKNNLYDLIRKNQNRKIFDGNDCLIITDEFQRSLISNEINAEDLICRKCDYTEIRNALNKLTHTEHEIITFLFFPQTSSKHTLKEFSVLKNISYSAAIKRKNTALRKLYELLQPIFYGGELHGN